MTPSTSRSLALALCLLSASAGAETVTGSFFYVNPQGTNLPTPAVDCEVEILVNGIVLARTRTATNGGFTVFVNVPNAPFLPSHPPAAFAARVFAHNRAANVHTSVPGTPVGPHSFTTGTTWSSANGATVDFGATTFGQWSSRHFHMADAIRIARAYADARRDPRETDQIPEVKVVPNQIPGNRAPTFWNAPLDQLEISDFYQFSGPTIAHEYAHFLEEKLSGFYPLPTNHDGCTARDLATGELLNSPEHAWMEGFADYFAGAVFSTGGLQGAFLGSAMPSTMEEPGACGVVGTPNVFGVTITADAVEDVVAATLFDARDADSRSATLPDGGVEAFDWVQGRDRDIFEIFDHELDHPSPTLRDFHDAWLRRGLDDGALDRVLATLGVDRASLEPSHARAGRERAQALASTPLGAPSLFAVSPAMRVMRMDDLAFGLTPWAEQSPLEGVPAAITVKGVSHVFWRTSQNQLAWRWTVSSGMSGIQVLGGYLGSSPSVAAFPDGRLIVCARDSTLALACAEQNSAGVFSWTWLGGTLRSQPVLAHDGASRLEVHALRAGDVTTVRAQVAGTWAAWRDTGGIGTSLPAAIPWLGGIELLVRGTDGALWRNRSVNGTLAGWTRLGALGDTLATAPDATFDSFGGLHVYAGMEPNAVVQRLWLSPGSFAGAFSDILPERVGASSAPHVVRQGELVRVVFRDTAGALRLADIQNFAVHRFTTIAIAPGVLRF